MAAADIYSFGITLYLLLNDLKFPASSGYYANPVQYSEEFIIPAPIHASEALTRIVRKMCSYHIRDRYQSMEEVMTDIRRIRGTVPEENDAECLEDLATATYRETDESKWEKDPGTGPENTEGRGKESREKRKEQKKEQERIFAEANAFAFFRFAILFFALFKIYVVKSEHLMMWQWWMLLAAVLIEGIFLTVKEFHVIFGILTIAISGYFLCTQTAGPGPLFLMLTVLIGIPSLTVGCAAGGILSSLQLLTGEFAWTNILTRWKIGWIVVVILSAAIEKSVFFNYRFDKISEERAKILLTLIDRIALYLTIAGLVLQFIRTFKILEISESLQNIRIARTGIGMLITHFLIMESEKQNEVENGSMDEE